MPSSRETFFQLLAKGLDQGSNAAQNSQDRQLRELLQEKQAEADLQKLSHAESLKRDTIKQQLEMAQGLSDVNKDRGVNVEGVSIGGKDMLGAFLRGQAVQDKNIQGI